MYACLLMGCGNGEQICGWEAQTICTGRKRSMDQPLCQLGGQSGCEQELSATWGKVVETTFWHAKPV